MQTETHPAPAANSSPEAQTVLTAERPLAPQPNPAAATLNQLLNPNTSSDLRPGPLSLQPLASALPEDGDPSAQLTTISPQPPTLVDAHPLDTQRHQARRRGRIASLPKGPRDMVNRMLANGVHYKNIVLALSELDFRVTERNVSNWATGGHRDWLLEQNLVLQNRLDQDHLVDHLRRDDASELPEVGLQAAATRVSQILLQKTARAQDIEANLDSFSQMVDVLCRLNREIGILQKQRDDSRRTLGRAYDAARIKNMDEISVNNHERFYSDPPKDSSLPKPAVPPMLPPVPTSSFLADCDEEDRMAKAAEDQKRLISTLQMFAGKKEPASNPGAAAPRTTATPPAVASTPPAAPAAVTTTQDSPPQQNPPAG